MTKLKTVGQAKKKIAELQSFVDLVEGYHAETLEQQIIKEYAYLGNLGKVAEKVNEMGYLIHGQPYKGTDITDVIRGKGNDELHKVIRSGYLLKTRHIRTNR